MPVRCCSDKKRKKEGEGKWKWKWKGREGKGREGTKSERTKQKNYGRKNKDQKMSKGKDRKSQRPGKLSSSDVCHTLFMLRVFKHGSAKNNTTGSTNAGATPTLSAACFARSPSLPVRRVRSWTGTLGRCGRHARRIAQRAMSYTREDACRYVGVRAPGAWCRNGGYRHQSGSLRRICEGEWNTHQGSF